MELDDAYSNGAYIPNGADYPAKWATAAAAFRETAFYEADVPYGPGARHVVDLFHPRRAARGVVVFVHGGYWLDFDKSFWSHLAAGPLAHGWAVAMPSYDLCPAVRISDITGQITQAVGMVAERIPGPIRLTGHSAGGHLVARMACADIHADWLAHIARIVPISPVADLAPLMRTSMNRDLRLTTADAAAESPVNHMRRDVPITVWVGAEERPAFLDQAKLLATAWNCDHVATPYRHHFDVVEDLADMKSALVAEILG